MGTPESDGQQQIRQIMSELLNVPREAIHAGFGPADAPTWDSLNHLRLVSALEEAFGISFAMRDVAELKSFRTIQQFVEAKLEVERKAK
jgi:acyl carrier protein